jgi:hypothetical protein
VVVTHADDLRIWSGGRFDGTIGAENTEKIHDTPDILHIKQLTESYSKEIRNQEECIKNGLEFSYSCSIVS